MDKKITRRDALKTIIAAGSGIVAAGFVPEKWVKPVVKSGVLPVHAQSSSPMPTQTPDYIQGNYFAGNTLTAFALVSSQPIAPTDNQAPSSTKRPGVSNPVEGKDVTLYVDGVKESTKPTDEYGYVEWILEFAGIQPNAIDPSKESVLRFEMVDGFNEVIFPGIA
jgi:hypothetical protein